MMLIYGEKIKIAIFLKTTLHEQEISVVPTL